MDFAQEGDKSGSIAIAWHFSSTHYVPSTSLYTPSHFILIVTQWAWCL